MKKLILVASGEKKHVVVLRAQGALTFFTVASHSERPIVDTIKLKVYKVMKRYNYYYHQVKLPSDALAGAGKNSAEPRELPWVGEP